MKNKIKKIMKIINCMVKYLYYAFYCKVKKIKNENIWLISERGNDARDNAYHFYKYLKKNHQEIKVRYVMDPSSADYKKIAKEDVVEYNTKEHYILFLTAGKLISTHIMGYSPDASLFWRLDKWNLLKLNGKRIFLQHGITQNYIEIMTSKVAKIDLFICGAEPEYRYILKNFGFSSDVVKYTGFARYDNLKNKEKNQILLMPTFRKWLNYTNDFTETEYFKSWNSLLNDNNLIDYLEKNNINLIFYPHYEIQKYITNFKSKSKNIIIANFKNYDVQQLLIESKLLITDYSSVFFDFAYMRKPVIYYQFDQKEFREKHYQKGYFDYEKMGFGPVCMNEKEVVENITKASNFNKERITNFFQYNDTNNCKRIYDEIIKLGK